MMKDNADRDILLFNDILAEIPMVSNKETGEASYTGYIRSQMVNQKTNDEKPRISEGDLNTNNSVLSVKLIREKMILG